MDCKQNLKQNLMACGALLGAWLLLPAVADAQSVSDSEKIQKLERQTDLLERQLRELKDELTRTRKKSADGIEVSAQAVASRRDPKSPIVKAPPPKEEKVKVTLGGFIAAESVWRQRNTVNDMGTAFTTIPFPFSPLFNGKRPAEPDLAARRGPNRSVPEGLGVL